MKHQKSSHHHSGHQHDAIIQKLLECATECEKCAVHSLEEEDVTSMAHCIELDRDCADICLLGARLLIRDSEVAHDFLAICEKICRKCAEECAKHEHDHCKHCAEVCSKCADACHAHHNK